jgi:hypothetical protein
MNRIELIKTQIDAIADHILGGNGYSFATLREISSALCQASARIEAFIIEHAPNGRGLLDGLTPPQDGGVE